jgi:predicted MFS family arabinose efflux permease
MCAIYIGCAVTGVLIIAFLLDNFKVKKSKDDLSIKDQILETVLMFKDCKVWLLLPLVALHPFVLAFVSTDISKAFVSCMLGVEYVGYWFVVFGVAAALFSYLVGFLAKYIGRIPLIIIALVISASLNVFLLLWKVNGQQYFILYSLAVFYGIFEAIHQTQVNGKVVFCLIHSLLFNFYFFFFNSSCRCYISRYKSCCLFSK